MTDTYFSKSNKFFLLSNSESEFQDANYFEQTILSKVVLNVSGFKYEIAIKNLKRIPKSRLGQICFAKSIDEINNLCDYFDSEKSELYFDRDPIIFNNILNYYRTGKLHVSENVCIIAFKDELEYWGVSEFVLDNCCDFKYYIKKSAFIDEIKKIQENEIETNKRKKFKRCCPNTRKIIWDIFDKPDSSILSKVFTCFSIFFILISMIILILNSIPNLKIKTYITNLQYEILGNETSTNNTTRNEKDSQENSYLEVAELTCVIWFTFEYLMQLYAAPDKKKFFKNILNTIDLLSILPYFVSVALQSFDQDLTKLNSARRLVALLRILRIMRLLKLVRHSKGLQLLGLTLQKSYKELGMLLFFVINSVIIFSSLVYFAEHDEDNTQFKSIPASFWWAIVTITTVGYGDMVPSTLLGKILTSMCCIFGLIIMALPISIIAHNFTQFYIEQNKHEILNNFQEQQKISTLGSNNIDSETQEEF